MSLRFIPPAEEKPKYRYASYAAGTMKLHGSVGAAKNSLNNRMWTTKVIPSEPNEEGFVVKPKRVTVTYSAAILENIDGTWYTLHEVKEGSEFKDLPWVKQYYKGTWGGWTLVSDYFRTSEYHQNKVKDGSYALSYRNTPLTTDEYVAFRLAVQKEQLMSFPHPLREVSVELEDEV